MLINPYGDGEARPASERQHDVTRQKYETMQCFAVSEPKSIKEEGEGILSDRLTSLLSGSFFFSVLVSVSILSFPVSCVLSSFHHHFF